MTKTMQAVQAGSASANDVLEQFKTRPPSCKPFFVDLNPQLIYIQQHTRYATNIPFTTLRNRLHELPPPPCTLLVMVKTTHRSHAVSFLSSRGYTVVPVSYHIGRITTGSASRLIFQPAPIVQHFLQTYHVSGTALDIACGSGRDTKFLTMMGLNVKAIDRSPLLLSKVRDLYNTNYYHPSWPTSSTGSLTTIERTFGMDRNDDINFLQSNASNLVIVIRFLRRGVLQHLHHTVLPFGYILYEHFLQGCERFSGPKKQSQMLQRGELRHIFTKDRGFTILLDQEHALDDGRPITRFIARRLVQ